MSVQKLPIVIDGTLHALPQGTWVFQQDGVLDIRVRVLQPLPKGPSSNRLP